MCEEDSIVNRASAVAGSFYPSNELELTHLIRQLLNGAIRIDTLANVVALVSPHAGYFYSGSTAAAAFKQLDPQKVYENVFIMGSSHRYTFEAASIYVDGDYLTPLGQVAVNRELGRQLIRNNPGLFITHNEAQANEHCIEVQLPFLQHLYGQKLRVVPVLLGVQNPVTCKKIADALRPYFNGRNLFVISTDFSHYPDYETACHLDKIIANAIIRNSTEDLTRAVAACEEKETPNLLTSICGMTSMLTLIEMTERISGIQYRHIIYRNSGDAPGAGKEKVVGYHAIAVTWDQVTENMSQELSQDDQIRLLKLVRLTLEEYLNTGHMPVSMNTYGELMQWKAGAFVTLKKHGQLRGCIGTFTAEKPLYQITQEMAVASAMRDPRFKPLTPDELSEVTIEISVLSPMRKIASVNEIILGKHGIYIIKGNQSGTFLPQVATDTGWNLEEFLGHCARDKAGLGWDGWKSADIYIFEATIFGEE
jgi:hypothetical protein